MRRASLIAFFLGAVIVACQLIAGIDDRTVFSRDGGEAGSADPCQSSGFPSAPDPSTSDPSDPIDVTLALHTIDTGTKVNPPQTWGFNLDKTCTCPQPNACKADQAFCDREAGVDDEGQNVFTELQTAAKAFDAGGFFDDSFFNNALIAGQSGLLVRLRGYNGKADDAQVKVAIYSSPGIETPTTPNWDGNDQWKVDTNYLNPTWDKPKYEADAYVRNFLLVASAAQIPIVVGSTSGQTVEINLNSGYIVAQLSVMGNQVDKMKGTLAGRWKAEDFLTSLQSVPDPVFKPGYLCQGRGIFIVIQKAVCGHRDVIAQKDNGNLNLVCDAVSFGVGFDALPAHSGAPTMPSATGYNCDGGVNYSATCN